MLRVTPLCSSKHNFIIYQETYLRLDRCCACFTKTIVTSSSMTLQKSMFPEKKIVLSYSNLVYFELNEFSQSTILLIVINVSNCNIVSIIIKIQVTHFNHNYSAIGIFCVQLQHYSIQFNAYLSNYFAFNSLHNWHNC